MTDLGHALAESPEFSCVAESNFLYAMFGPDEDGRVKLHEAYRRDRSSGPRPKEYREFARHLGRGLERLFESRAQGRRWVDCAHENVLVAPELANLFPTARFIHLVRDGRAVVQSGRLAGAGWAGDLRSAATTWVHFARQGVAFEKRFPERVLRVHAERLMSAPSVAMAVIGEFLGAERSEAPADWLAQHGLSPAYANAEQDAGWPGFDVPEDGDWKTWSVEDRIAFTGIAAEAMREFGYWRAV